MYACICDVCIYTYIHIYTFKYLRMRVSVMFAYVNICIFLDLSMSPFAHVSTYPSTYEVATISKLLKIIGLLCRIWSLL